MPVKQIHRRSFYLGLAVQIVKYFPIEKYFSPLFLVHIQPFYFTAT